MAVETCPFCQARFISASGDFGACPACSKAFASALPVEGQDSLTLHLRSLARYQRRLILIVTALIASYAILFTGPFIGRHIGLPIVLMFLPWVWLFMEVLAIVTVVHLLSAMARHSFVCILYAILTLLPPVGVLVLLAANSQASQVLRRHGIQVGLLGARDDDVIRRTDPRICRECGYSLIGNVSGKCPECGSPVTCQGCGYDLSGLRGPRCPECGRATAWSLQPNEAPDAPSI